MRLSKTVFFPLMILLVTYSIYIYIYLMINRTTYQWDFKKDYYAALAFRTGENPYDVKTLAKLSGGQYSYPPLTLYAFVPFTYINFDTANLWYFHIKLVILFLLLMAWSRYLLHEKANLTFALFCLFAFNSTLYLDIRSGNINLLEQLFLWAAFYAFISARHIWFCILLVLASSFKIQPLLFIGLLFFPYERKNGKLIAGTIIFFIGYLLLSYIFYPGLFNQFVLNARGAMSERGVVCPSTFAAISDICMRILPQGFPPMPRKMVLIVLFSIVVTLIASYAWKISRIIAKRQDLQSRILLVYYACCTYALIIPRFKDFMYVLLIPPAYYLIMDTRFVSRGFILAYVLLLLPTATKLPVINNWLFLWEYYPLWCAAVLWGIFSKNEQDRAMSITG